MASKSKRPATFVVITRTCKTFSYDLADMYDSWGTKYDDTVLEIETDDGKVFFWPVERVKMWKIIPKATLSPHA